MRGLPTIAVTIFAWIFLVMPAMAQKQAVIDSTEPRHIPSTRAAGSSSSPNGGGTASSSAPDYSGATGSYGGGAYYGGLTPNLTGTSFGSLYLYYDWINYYSYLCRTYHMNPDYFARFYRHQEPLITPRILKLTLQTPLQQSSHMLAAIDELEMILQRKESGESIGKNELLGQLTKIRGLAKKIRKNQTLSLVDLRKDKELYDIENCKFSSPEALRKMREMALDIERQLRNLYNQPTTSIISVEDYQQPSLESLAKGIEKICKAIENSTKRM